MFIRVSAVDNISASRGHDFEDQILNVGDIFLVKEFDEPDSRLSQKSLIEMRGPAPGSEYPYFQLFCKESIDEIEAKIQRALSPQRIAPQHRR